MRKSRIAAILFVVTASCTSVHANEQLLGTWRLVGFTAEVVPTGERVDAFGDSPQGYLSYTSDGHVLVIMAKEGRPKRNNLAQMTDRERVELFNSMVAYGGRFRVDGDRIIHNVDISWNENWTGTAQVRRFRIEGRRLIITQDPQVGPDGRQTSAVLTWERVQ